MLSYHSFLLGWKREMVYRNTSKSTFKKMADIYYYTPSGKKVRSNRELLENLSMSWLNCCKILLHFRVMVEGDGMCFESG